MTRDARKAAHAAAKELGQPAIAAEFELTRLYGPSTTKAADANPQEATSQQPAPPAPADPSRSNDG